jgi:arginine repressor
MSDMLEWSRVRREIEPIAVSHLEEIQETLREEGLEVSEVENSRLNTNIWSMTVTKESGDMVYIYFSFETSVETEGEMLGYNISRDVSRDDETELISYTPYKRTDDEWTNDLSELVERAEDAPLVSKGNL